MTSTFQRALRAMELLIAAVVLAIGVVLVLIGVEFWEADPPGASLAVLAAGVVVSIAALLAFAGQRKEAVILSAALTGSSLVVVSALITPNDMRTIFWSVALASCTGLLEAGRGLSWYRRRRRD
jgi:hypothetical protein